MSTPTVTEKQTVLRERAAFEDAVNLMAERLASLPWDKIIVQQIREEITKRYPLPKTTRPRVVECIRIKSAIPMNWRYVDGGFEWCEAGRRDWHRPTLDLGECAPSFIKMLADLAANPTEECDAE